MTALVVTALRRNRRLVACAWHAGDAPITRDVEIMCPECLCLIATRWCEACAAWFLDWGFVGDDVIAGPGVSCEDDFMCVRCVARIDAVLDIADEEGACP